MTRGLLVAAFVCCLVAVSLAFDAATVDGEIADPVGWLAAGFGLFVLAGLIPDRGR